MDLPFKLPPDLQGRLNDGLRKVAAIRGKFDPTTPHKPVVSNVPAPGSAPTSLAPWQGVFGSPDMAGAQPPRASQSPFTTFPLGVALLSIGALWYVIRGVSHGRSRDPFDPSFYTRGPRTRRRK